MEKQGKSPLQNKIRYEIRGESKIIGYMEEGGEGGVIKAESY